MLVWSVLCPGGLKGEGGGDGKMCGNVASKQIKCHIRSGENIQKR